MINNVAKIRLRDVMKCVLCQTWALRCPGNGDGIRWEGSIHSDIFHSLTRITKDLHHSNQAPIFNYKIEVDIHNKGSKNQW